MADIEVSENGPFGVHGLELMRGSAAESHQCPPSPDSKDETR